MRTTIDIPEDLVENAMRASKTRTKTETIILGLKELISRHKVEGLRSLQGKINITTDLKISRKR